MAEKFVSTKEAAERLGITPTSLRTMIKHGEIKALRKGRLAVVSEADLRTLLDQKQGRMEGDMAMSEIRALEEFKENLVLALEDKVVKQALQRCIGGAGFKKQFLEALDAPEVREKLTRIRKK
jgi:excisionase family DNA binding protein